MAEVINIPKRSPLCIAVGNKRHGMERMGVPRGGCADFVSHSIANRLVGNADERMTLEMTLVVPQITFVDDALFAFCGGMAELDLIRGGERIPIEYGRALAAKRGDTISGGVVTHGLRAYLAIDGGVISMGETTFCRETSPKKGTPPMRTLGDMTEYWCGKRSLFALEGIHAEQFSAEALELFYGSEFTVSPHSDRMGLRLEGAKLSYAEGFDGNIISEAVAPGDIQVTPNGDPILMLCDCQPTGGYAKIAHIASCDIPSAAQLRPGDSIRFAKTTAEDAQRRLIELRSMIGSAVAPMETEMIIVVNGQRYEVSISEVM